MIFDRLSFYLTKLLEDWSNVSAFFTQVNVEQKKGFSIQEEPNVTTSGSLRKPIQITESKKDCSEEENKFTSMPESTFLLSEKCNLLKRKCCSEEMRSAEVPCKLMKKGMFNYRTGSMTGHPWKLFFCKIQTKRDQIPLCLLYFLCCLIKACMLWKLYCVQREKK